MANQKRGHLGPMRSEGQAVMELIRSLPLTWEGTLTAGVSPVLCEFNAAQSFNACQGWINNDGPGDILASFTRDGSVYGDLWTIKQGELTSLKGFDIYTLRLTHSGADAAYRVFLI